MRPSYFAACRTCSAIIEGMEQVMAFRDAGILSHLLVSDNVVPFSRTNQTAPGNPLSLLKGAWHQITCGGSHFHGDASL